MFHTDIVQSRPRSKHKLTKPENSRLRKQSQIPGRMDSVSKACLPNTGLVYSLPGQLGYYFKTKKLVTRADDTAPQQDTYLAV